MRSRCAVLVALGFVTLTAACGGRVDGVDGPGNECGAGARCSAPTPPEPTPLPPYENQPPLPSPSPAAKRCGHAVVEVRDCATDEGYAVSSYASGTPADPEVHVIAVYETRSDHSFGYHPRGKATVSVERPGKHVLVLSSYEPTDFVVKALPGAIVERVILEGYHHHTVVAPTGATVDDRSGDDASAPGSYVCRYEWSASCESGVKAMAGPPSAYGGCYRATDFAIKSGGPGCE